MFLTYIWCYMADPTYYPTLSEEAWASTPGKIADSMMSHFLTANFSQTYLFAGQVASFTYILAVNHGNIPSITTSTKSALETFFGRVFNAVNVQVTDETPPGESKAIIKIAVDFTDNEGKTYSVGELLRTSGQTFEIVTDYLNNGPSS